MGNNIKIIVYIPAAHTKQMLDALAKAGAGKTGNYDSCSFTSSGIGRFRPLPGAHPFIGETGKLTEVSEDRIEVIIEKERMEELLAVIKKVHPYEVPAIEVLDLLYPS